MSPFNFFKKLAVLMPTPIEPTNNSIKFGFKEKIIGEGEFEILISRDNNLLSEIADKAFIFSGVEKDEQRKEDLLKGLTIEATAKKGNKVWLEFRNNNPQESWVNKIIFKPKTNPKGDRKAIQREIIERVKGKLQKPPSKEL